MISKKSVRICAIKANVVGDITVEYSDGTSGTGWYGYYITATNSWIK